jgi:hypothetical protein
MSTIFTHVAADVARDQVFPALINKIEVKGGAELEAAYVDCGPLDGVKFMAEARSQNSSGGVPIQIGYKTTLEGSILATGSNMRASVNEVIGNAHDVRLTDVNGHVWELLSNEFAIAISESVEGDFEGARKFPVKGGGFLTKARFDACFTAA